MALQHHIDYAIMRCCTSLQQTGFIGMVEEKLRGNLFQAATKAFDIQNPTQAIISLLQTTTELLAVERSALYELDESGNGFVPRFAHGIAMSELGRVASKSEHKILQEVFSKNQATSTNGEAGSLGLPLAPGLVACAPCRISGQTIGLLFAGRDEGKGFEESDLATLEILAARAAEVFTHARRSREANSSPPVKSHLCR
jgi:GAF domain-containing protein